MTEEPKTYPDDLLMSVGLIALVTSALENVMAQLAESVDPSLAFESLVASTPGLRREVRGCVAVLSESWPERAPDLNEWFARAERCLDERHSIVHAATMWDTEEKAWVAWHPRSGVRKSFDLEEVSAAAHRADLCAQHGLHLCALVYGRYGLTGVQ